MSGLQAAALAAPVAVVLLERGAPAARVLVAALLVSLAAELTFALLRKRTPSWHGATAAMAVAVLAPVDLPAWQVAMATGFGVILSDLVFGGRGFGFLSPAVTALAFVVFSFPQAELAPPDLGVAIAALPGAAVLMATGLLSVRVVVTAFAAYLLAAATLQGQSPGAVAPMATVVFGLAFLTGDPSGAATTATGRLLYGALAGYLWVVFGGGAGATPEAVVFGTLVASLFAPLVDDLVVRVHVARRRRRLG